LKIAKHTMSARKRPWLNQCPRKVVRPSVSSQCQTGIANWRKWTREFPIRWWDPKSQLESKVPSSNSSRHTM
jgi:hypothetical protein